MCLKIDIDKEEKIRKKMAIGVSEGVFPGGVLLISKDGETVFEYAEGNISVTDDTSPVETCTIFDTASLTKPVVTTTLIGILIEQGILSLDFHPEKFIPFPNKKEIRLKHLLSHSSGLPPWRPLYRLVDISSPKTERKTIILNAIHEIEVMAKPEEKTRYSDLGFIILGEIIEKVTGKELDVLADEYIFKPLGMKDTFFNNKYNHPISHFAAATESRFTGDYCRGVVSDDNCYAMGGVSGHAGMFSTAANLSLFTNEMIRSVNGSSNILPSSIIRLFTRRFSDLSSWGLGWDTPSDKGSSAGELFTKGKSFGHLGFTGVSIWIDAERQISIILLTNRVHPSSSNTAIRKFRPEIHNIAMEACLT